MGIRLLSKLLKKTYGHKIQTTHLSKLSGKKICIDTSIYLYRYKSQDAMLEKFYLMCSIFKKYNIIPVFIFDGKPSELKQNTINERREKRELAWQKYEKYKNKVGENPNKKQLERLTNIKRTFIKINKTDIENIKSLIDSYGMKYINAQSEADILCASLVKQKKVYAVLTEDMDLFAYGCNVILRYLSLVNHTCMLYNMKDILKILHINLTDFQTLCIISGTDYNKSTRNIFQNLDLYKKYNKSGYNCFKYWLLDNNYIADINTFNTILDVFNNTNNELKNYPYILIKYGYVNVSKLFSILKKERFIFV